MQVWLFVLFKLYLSCGSMGSKVCHVARLAGSGFDILNDNVNYLERNGYWKGVDRLHIDIVKLRQNTQFSH